MSYIVYKHTNTINNKVYIGITMHTLQQRSGKDGNGYKECPYFYYAIQKYGWHNFSHEVLESVLTREEAAQKEIYYIKLYNSRNPDFGYNLAKGGYSQPGKDNPFYGHTQSQKVRDAVAA